MTLCITILDQTGVFTIWMAAFDVMVQWIDSSIYIQINSCNENNKLIWFGQLIDIILAGNQFDSQSMLTQN